MSVFSARSEAGPGAFLPVLLVAAVVLAGGLADRAAAAGEPEALKAGYRRVLSVLAGGDEAEALSALFDFETGALGDLPTGRQLEHFWRLKLRVIRRLLESQTIEVLVPIVVLHHDALLMYRERHRPVLVAHSRKMASELAEIYAEKAGTRRAGLFAGWVFTSFGAYFQDSRSVTASARFFRRALDFDPANEVALLGLAAAFEKKGEYRQAMSHLERHLEIHPNNQHVRLRLAVCLTRGGDYPREQGLNRLARLIETEAPAWIRSVAYQELARAHLEDGQDQRAEQLLRQGLEELPGDQQLSIQLASLLDRQRRPREASRLLSQIASGGWEEDSPRQIYDAWPREGLEEARATLREMMKSRSASLLRPPAQVPGG